MSDDDVEDEREVPATPAAATPVARPPARTPYERENDARKTWGRRPLTNAQIDRVWALRRAYRDGETRAERQAAHDALAAIEQELLPAKERVGKVPTWVRTFARGGRRSKARDDVGPPR